MVAGYAAGRSIFGVVIADDKPIHRDLHFAAFHTAGPLFHRFRKLFGIGQLAVDGGETEPVQIVHALTP